MMNLHNLIRHDAAKDSGGGAGNADQNTDNATGQNSGQESVAEEKKTFTQTELNALFSERAKQASSKAQSDLLATLGVKSADEVKALLEDARKLRDSQLSELDKTRALAESEKARADAAEKAQADMLAKASEKLMRAEVLAEAAKQGFRDEAVSDVWLVLASDAKLKEQVQAADDGFEGIESVVKGIAKSKPHWLKGNPKENINAGNQNKNADGALTDEQRRELAAIYGVKPEYITPAR